MADENTICFGTRDVNFAIDTTAGSSWQARFAATAMSPHSMASRPSPAMERHCAIKDELPEVHILPLSL